MPILTTNANFMPTTPAEARAFGIDSAPFISLDRMNDIVEATGADGFTFLPIASPLSWQLRRASAATPGIQGLKAMHGSFYGVSQQQPSPELDFAPGELEAAGPNGSFLTEFAVSRLMPEGDVSVARLSGIAHRIGRGATMSCAVFSDGNGDVKADQKLASHFPGGAFVQPTPDVAAVMGIRADDPKAPQTLRKQFLLRGFHLAWPSFHIGRLGQVVRLRLDEDAFREEFISGDPSMIGEVHAELNRLDFAELDPKRWKVSRQEAIALITGSGLEKLPLGETLQTLREVKWIGNILTEATIGGMRDALEVLGIRGEKKDVLAAHRDVTDHLRAYVA